MRPIERLNRHRNPDWIKLDCLATVPTRTDPPQCEPTGAQCAALPSWDAGRPFRSKAASRTRALRVHRMSPSAHRSASPPVFFTGSLPGQAAGRGPRGP
jgi:hypothetical protein